VTNQWPKARKRGVLERMFVIRRFEESLVQLFAEKAFTAHFHLYIGQEATGVAIMETLRLGDRLATTHRNHSHVLARMRPWWRRRSPCRWRWRPPISWRNTGSPSR